MNLIGSLLEVNQLSAAAPDFGYLLKMAGIGFIGHTDIDYFEVVLHQSHRAMEKFGAGEGLGMDSTDFLEFERYLFTDGITQSTSQHYQIVAALQRFGSQLRLCIHSRLQRLGQFI